MSVEDDIRHHYYYYCWVTEVGTAAMIQVRPSSSESSTVFLSVEITFSGVLRLLETSSNYFCMI